ncbi:CLUMA_CG014644, isoform A [Clunio marinus]|uniref:CLUMA_CG014644, isoform A n=1 Tax=Clunio marinus TaxID=568069 RepID=A0A1J1IMX8_9DIPT|nr:CLUMA_CG014644, isoform A [Clunio marinus]
MRKIDKARGDVSDVSDDLSTLASCFRMLLKMILVIYKIMNLFVYKAFKLEEAFYEAINKSKSFQ